MKYTEANNYKILKKLAYKEGIYHFEVVEGNDSGLPRAIILKFPLSEAVLKATSSELLSNHIKQVENYLNHVACKISSLISKKKYLNIPLPAKSDGTVVQATILTDMPIKIA